MDPADEIGGGQQCIPPTGHGRSARVAGFASHSEPQAALPSDAGYHSHRQVESLKKRSLFEVSFDVANHVVRIVPASFQTAGVEAKLDHRFAHRNALFVHTVQPRGVKSPGHRRAAQDRASGTERPPPR